MYLCMSHDSMYPSSLWLSLRSQSASKHIKQIICNYWKALGMFLQILWWKSVVTTSTSITNYSLTLSPCESKSIWSDGHFCFSSLPLLSLASYLHSYLNFIHLKLTKINQTKQFHMGRNASFLDYMRQGFHCFLVCLLFYTWLSSSCFCWDLLHFNGEQQIKTHYRRPKHNCLPSTCAW